MAEATYDYIPLSLPIGFRVCTAMPLVESLVLLE